MRDGSGVQGGCVGGRVDCFGCGQAGPFDVRVEIGDRVDERSQPAVRASDLDWDAELRQSVRMWTFSRMSAAPKPRRWGESWLPAVTTTVARPASSASVLSTSPTAAVGGTPRS